jgi:hypothetical protein
MACIQRLCTAYRKQLEHVEFDHCEAFCLAVCGYRYLDVDEELREQRQQNYRTNGGKEQKKIKIKC